MMVKQAREQGLLSEEHFSVDGTILPLPAPGVQPKGTNP